MSAISHRPMRRSRARRTSCGWKPGSSASPACPWSRARRSAITTARPDCYTIHAGTGGGVVRERQILATVLNVPEQQCRAVCGDMGGNFGTRNSFFPEYALLPWAARRVGRPVKWYGDRTECFVSDFHGRDLTVTAELALDARREFPRPARHQSQQCRRLHRAVRAAAQRPRHHVGRLSHSGGAFPRLRRDDPHDADDAVSQRRPARGDLRD